MGGGSSKATAGWSEAHKNAELHAISGSDGTFYYQVGETQKSIFLPNQDTSSEALVVIQPPDAKEIYIVSDRAIN